MPTSYPTAGQLYVPAVNAASGLNGGNTFTPYSNVSLTPAATGALILDRLILPPYSMDRAGIGYCITAFATTAANTNAKTLSFNFGGTGAVGVAVTGGTSIATVTTSTSAVSLYLQAYVYRTTASNQTYAGVIGIGGTGGVLGAPTTGTMTVSETGTIQVNLIVNNATTANDSVVQFWSVAYLG